jgi:hypothetical protein
MNEDNSIDIHMTFPSPTEAIPVADALAEEGWDVTMHVVLEARAAGSDEHLQRMHDGLKELLPRLGLSDIDATWEAGRDR